MIEQVRTWLNGTRDYFIGVVLYDALGQNKALKDLFSCSKSTFNQSRLEKELEDLFENSKKNIESPKPIQLQTKKRNIDLENTCKQVADKEYKRIMNLRAVLFKMSISNDFSDPNRPDFIQQRAPIALQVCEGYKNLSLLYDKWEFVKKYGHLPDTDPQDSDYSLIPDALVKPTLDNTRKAMNKLKNKQITPERLQLIQEHEKNIIVLKARWDKIKI